MPKTFPWVEPLALAHTLTHRGEAIAFLYSGMCTGYSGRYSYLAWEPGQCIEASQMCALEMISADAAPLPHWFGYIGYECVHALEILPSTGPASIVLPDLRFCRYAKVLRFDHQEHIIEGDGVTSLPDCGVEPFSLPQLHGIPRSHMDEHAYLAHVSDALEQIHAGKFYQVNLTRKLEGEWQQTITDQQAFALFRQLCDASPAPYSAFLIYAGQHVMSSSPELFLSLTPDGCITTRPIKGTASLAGKHSLHTSAKDQAENLMIVDLMRHDLSRVAVPGSVHVPGLFEVDAFSTLQHLSSTVQGQLRDGLGVSDLLQATFPPGSMTGAPKIAAMRWIAEHETVHRGVYSGALGWINGCSCELSVVIRTLITQGNRYEFQVGGGIVADSDPEAEYRETQIKAAGICRALGLDHTKI